MFVLLNRSRPQSCRNNTRRLVIILLSSSLNQRGDLSVVAHLYLCSPPVCMTDGFDRFVLHIHAMSTSLHLNTDNNHDDHMGVSARSRNGATGVDVTQSDTCVGSRPIPLSFHRVKAKPHACMRQKRALGPSSSSLPSGSGGNAVLGCSVGLL